MAVFKSTDRMSLTKVAAWRDEKGRWHVVWDDPDVQGTSKGLHLRVSPSTKNHENLTAAYEHLTSLSVQADAP